MVFCNGQISVTIVKNRQIAITNTICDGFVTVFEALRKRESRVPLICDRLFVTNMSATYIVVVALRHKKNFLSVTINLFVTLNCRYKKRAFYL